jgi:MATE family multidrug resistance protein
MRALVRLAIPVAFSNLGLMAMGLVDLMAVGRLGAEAVSAVGLGVSISAWGLTIGIGLLAGLDFVASSALGAGNRFRSVVAFREAWRGTFFLGVPAALLIAASGWGLEVIGIPAEIAQKTRPFLVPISLSLLPSWWFQVSRQMLQAYHHTRPVVVSLIVANGANILGNIFWVAGAFGFASYGVEASGWVTFGSRLVMAAIATAALYRLDPGLWKENVEIGQETRSIRRELLRLGVPGGFQMGLEVGVFSLSTVLAARLGAVSGAAHQIALNLASVTFMVPLGIGQAAAVLVGRAIGAGKRAEAFRQGWSALGISSAFMSMTCAIFLSIPEVLISLYTREPEVLSLGSRVLWIAGVFQLFDGLQVTMTGTLRGVGNTRDSAIANAVGHWLVGLPLALWLSPRWNLLGIWTGLAVGLGVVGFLQLWRWRVEERKEPSLAPGWH